MRGSIKKSPIKLSMQWKINWHDDLFTNGENLHYKNPIEYFNITTLENLQLSKQVVTSKGILVPYTNLQLNPYSNIQLDLFYSDNLFFSMHGSQYVTIAWILVCDLIINLRRMLVAKFFSSSHDEYYEVLGHKTLWCTNTTTSLRERWTRAN